MRPRHFTHAAQRDDTDLGLRVRDSRTPPCNSQCNSQCNSLNLERPLTHDDIDGLRLVRLVSCSSFDCSTGAVVRDSSVSDCCALAFCAPTHSMQEGLRVACRHLCSDPGLLSAQHITRLFTSSAALMRYRMPMEPPLRPFIGSLAVAYCTVFVVFSAVHTLVL